MRTQRVLQIILGLFWLLDAGLQFQPYMFGSGFTTTYLLNNAHNQPDIVRWIITNVGNFVGPHVAVWNTFFALIQVAIGLGLLFRPDRATGPRRVVLLGLRRLVLRGRPRPDLHRIGLRPHRRTGFGVPLRTDRPDGLATVSSHRGGRGDGTERRHRVLGRRTGHRRSGDAPRWCGAATGRWRRSCSCCRTTGPRRRSRARSRACRRASRARTPTFSTASATISAVAASGPRGCWPSARSSSGSGPSCSADRLRSSPPVACWRPSSGSAVRVSAASSPARGPTRTLGPSSCSWRWPWCRPCCRIRRLGSPRSRPRSFAIPWLVLGGVVALVAGLFLSAVYPVAAQESTEHGHGRHDRHVRGRRRVRAEGLRRRPPVRGGTTARPRSGLDVDEHTEHGHGWARHRS